MTKAKIVFFFNEEAYTEAEINDFRASLADYHIFRVERKPDEFLPPLYPMLYPLPENAFLLVILSGILGGVAGGFLEAVGEDVWALLKSKMQEFFRNRKQILNLRLRLEDCAVLN